MILVGILTFVVGCMHIVYVLLIDCAMEWLLVKALYEWLFNDWYLNNSIYIGLSPYHNISVLYKKMAYYMYLISCNCHQRNLPVAVKRLYSLLYFLISATLCLSGGPIWVKIRIQDWRKCSIVLLVLLKSWENLTIQVVLGGTYIYKRF